MMLIWTHEEMTFSLVFTKKTEASNIKEMIHLFCVMKICATALSDIAH